jgi:hypothetical protein
MALLWMTLVFTPAGRTALTAIPSAARSSACDLTIPTAAWCPLVLAPIRGTTQAVATIRPHLSAVGKVPRDAAGAGSDAHGVGWR